MFLLLARAEPAVSWGYGFCASKTLKYLTVFTVFSTQRESKCINCTHFLLPRVSVRPSVSCSAGEQPWPLFSLRSAWKWRKPVEGSGAEKIAACTLQCLVGKNHRICTFLVWMWPYMFELWWNTCIPREREEQRGCKAKRNRVVLG